MMVLTSAARTGQVVADFNAPANKNTLVLTIAFTAPPGAVAFTFQLEQSDDNVTYWPLGSVTIEDIRGTDRQGLPLTERVWTFTDQLMRDDIANGHGYAYSHTHQVNGRNFRQLDICQNHRLTITTSGLVTYQVTADFDDRPLPAAMLAVLGAP